MQRHWNSQVVVGLAVDSKERELQERMQTVKGLVRSMAFIVKTKGASGSVDPRGVGKRQLDSVLEQGLERNRTGSGNIATCRGNTAEVLSPDGPSLSPGKEPGAPERVWAGDILGGAMNIGVENGSCRTM